MSAGLIISSGKIALSIKVNKANNYYILLNIFILFFITGAITLPVANYPLRLNYLCMAFLTIIFSVFIFKTLFKYIASGNWVVGLIIYFLVFHPIFIFFLITVGIREIPSSLGILSPLTSGASWSIAFIILAVAYKTCDWQDYNRIFHVLFFIFLFFSLECILGYYILKLPFFIEETGGYGGGIFHIGSGNLGRLGILFIVLSIVLRNNSRSKFRKLFLIGFPLGIILTLSTGSRPVFASLILALALILFLTFLLLRNKTQVEIVTIKVMILPLIILLAAFAFSHIADKSKIGNFFSYRTFWTRTVTWARGVELGIKHFPIGLGGGLLTSYNADENIQFTFPEKIIRLTGDPDGEQAFKIRWYERLLPYMNKHSIHSAQIDLFAGFGFVGLLIIILMLTIPIKFILLVLVNIKKSSNHMVIYNATVIGAALLALQFSMFTASINHVMWIIGIFYLYLIRERQRIKRQLKLSTL